MAELSIPKLVTDRLVVTLLPSGAEARMVAYHSENREHLEPWSPPSPDALFTEPYWRERIAAAHEELRAGTAVRLVLVERDDPDGPIVGNIGLSQIARGPFQACYLGYALAARLEGRGYMYEALQAAIGYAFEDLRLHRIMANYVPTNERSGRLLRRLGFTVEGYARDYLFIAGEWRDHVLASLTNGAMRQPPA